MKRLLLPSVILMAYMMPFFLSCAQGPLTSGQMIEGILSEPAHREVLTKLNAGITTVLADERFADQVSRQMLQQSRIVLQEMLNQKIGSNAEKLVELARWMDAQDREQTSIHDSGEAATPQQQFVLDNPLAGQEVYLTSIINWVLREYIEMDGEAAGQPKLEGYLQLYEPISN